MNGTVKNTCLIKKRSRGIRKEEKMEEERGKEKIKRPRQWLNMEKILEYSLMGKSINV